MEIKVKAEAELAGAARQILAFAGDRRKFVLTGDLGAGKTTLIKAVCQQLGVQDTVTSPTFSLVNVYHRTTETSALEPLYHLDLYRLDEMQEALDIGIEDYLYDECYCFVEWPEIVEAIWPEQTVQINISLTGDSVRKILLL